VNLGLNPPLGKPIANSVAILQADHHVVIDVIESVGIGSRQAWDHDVHFEFIDVALRESASLAVEEVDVGELRSKDGGLDLVEARIETGDIVVMVAGSAVVTEFAETLSQVVVVGNDGAGVAQGAQLAGRMET
jgi:hypothetical protein